MKPIKDMKKPLVIGIIGGAGTGKTFFSEKLVKKLDAFFVEGDAVGHSTLNRPEIIQAVSHRFGMDVISPEGVVDRKSLGGKVFGDKDALKDLNAIMHPKMYRVIEEMIRETDRDLNVLEAAVIIEGRQDEMNYGGNIIDRTPGLESFEDEIDRICEKLKALSASL